MLGFTSLSFFIVYRVLNAFAYFPGVKSIRWKPSFRKKIFPFFLFVCFTEFPIVPQMKSNEFLRRTGILKNDSEADLTQTCAP